MKSPILALSVLVLLGPGLVATGCATSARLQAPEHGALDGLALDGHGTGREAAPGHIVAADASAIAGIAPATAPTGAIGIGAVEGRESAAGAAADALAGLGPAAPPQDYSPTGMFREKYGDYLARASRYRPMIEASFYAVPNASIKNDPGDFDLVSLRSEGRVPIVVDPDSEILLGGHFGIRRYEFSSDFRGGVENETVYDLGAIAGYSRFLNADTKLDLEFRPGVYTDLEGQLTSDDWKFFARGLVTYQYDETVFFKGGIRYNEDFEDAPVLPMAGVSWLFYPDWRLDVLLPELAEVSWSMDAATILSAGVELSGNEYRVRSSVETGKQRLDMRVQEIELYLGGTRRFNDHLSGFARVGVVVAGDHDFTGPTGIRAEGTLDPSFMVEVGAGWDF